MGATCQTRLQTKPSRVPPACKVNCGLLIWYSIELLYHNSTNITSLNPWSISISCHCFWDVTLIRIDGTIETMPCPVWFNLVVPNKFQNYKVIVHYLWNIPWSTICQISDFLMPLLQVLRSFLMKIKLRIRPRKKKPEEEIPKNGWLVGTIDFFFLFLHSFVAKIT